MKFLIYKVDERNFWTTITTRKHNNVRENKNKNTNF